VQGYLAFWDELRRRHPNMLIDSCASGGRRNDLETLRRSVPLLRSDYIFEPVGQQCHTYGLAMWLPFFGSGFIATDAYSIRSTLCPALNTCWDVRREDLPYDEMRARIAEWRALAPSMILGDFYPLTPYTRDNHQWMAWQFDRPETGEGAVQVFRRGDSFYESARLHLSGLQAEATYALTDADSGAMGEWTGRELMQDGLVVAVTGRPEAKIVSYKRK